VDSLIIHAGQIAGALIAILTLGGILVKWGIVKPIKAYIDQMTYSIQPHANGGKSLPDIANAVHRLEEKLDRHIETDHSCNK
jgi:uncharacterized oligopeptide transporter (OPT) family protein